MNTIELSELEHQINQLLHSLELLKQENNALRQKIANYTRERSSIVEKNIQIAQKIKKLIAQLREEIL